MLCYYDDVRIQSNGFLNIILLLCFFLFFNYYVNIVLYVLVCVYLFNIYEDNMFFFSVLLLISLHFYHFFFSLPFGFSPNSFHVMYVIHVNTNYKSIMYLLKRQCLSRALNIFHISHFKQKKNVIENIFVL